MRFDFPNLCSSPRTRTRMQGGLGVLTAALVSLAPGAVAAEGFIDLAFGAAFTDDERVEVRRCSAVGCPSQNFKFDGSFQDSFAFSLRGGGWFGRQNSWLGLGGGFSIFNADVKGFVPTTGVRDVDLYLLPLSLQLLFRIPIAVDEQFPGGRFQPYVAVGPAFTISVLSVDNVSGNDGGDASFDVGADVRAGMTVMLERWIGLFAEYRYTYVPVDFDDAFDDLNARFEADLQTHHVAGGVTFRF